MYIVVEDPVTDIRIKLAGEIETNPLTGQITVALRELPQLPIGDLKLHFFGGERALLTTPSACGPATSTSELAPWSENAGVAMSSTFEVIHGVNSALCSEPPSFDPSFQAESTAAGETDAYNSVTLRFSRVDQEEELGTIAIQGPAGRRADVRGRAIVRRTASWGRYMPAGK